MLADRIRTLMEARGWNENTLAAKSKLSDDKNLTPDSVRKIVTGKRRDLPLSTLQALAGAFEMTISEMIGEAPTDDTEAREIYRQVMALRGVDGRQLLSKLAKLDEAGMGLLVTFATGWLAKKG